MPGALQLGKRLGRTLAATGVTGLDSSRLFFVTDTHTSTRFLVDTGSEVSVIPPTPADRRRSPDPRTLTAVSNTSIRTYGQRSLTLNLGLRHYGLMVDMHKCKLIDTSTHLQVQGILSSGHSPSPSLCCCDTSNPYLALLSEFPTLTQVTAPDTPVQHDVCHHIETTGPPVSAHPRQLAPKWFKAAKREFEHMLQLGIIRPSSSSWSSPLHMVPKKTQEAGDPVVTIVHSTGTQYQTGTLYFTFMISLPLYRMPPLSPNSIWSVPITRYP